MKVIALVQARLGSVRLPEKVLRQIADKPLIELLLTRLSRSTEIDEIVVATSEEPLNNKLQLFVESLGFQCYRGSEKDVLKRFYEILEDCYRKFGAYKEKLISFTQKGKEGATKIKAMMEEYRNNPPKEIAGIPVMISAD